VIALARQLLRVLFAEVERVAMPPDLTKLHTAAQLDDINLDWKLLGFVTDEPTYRRFLFGKTADEPLVDVIPWTTLLVGAA
jgi:hypothetical protein